MAKKCTSVPAAQAPCCVAAGRGLLGKTFTFVDSRGATRCAECSVVQSKSKKHPGAPVFQFRFHKSQECGIVNGCPALGRAAGAGGVPAASSPTTQGFLLQ